MKIFVARSFGTEDKALIATFVDFLESQGHEIVTGERAEPKNVAEKVHGRIRSCDLLIAILTKQNVIYEEGLINRMMGKVSAYTFPPWVLHELSFAMGLGMQYIMLIEDCVVDSVPNFHGDKENIRFNREAPEKSFQGLTQMLVSLQTKQPETTAEPSQPPPEEEKSPDAQKEAAKKEETNNFGKQYFKAVSEENVNEVIRLFNEEIKKEVKDEDDLIFWDSLTWRFAYRNGRTDAFKKLETLPERYKNKALSHMFLGDAYQELGAYDKADENYKKVLEYADLTTEQGAEM